MAKEIILKIIQKQTTMKKTLLLLSSFFILAGSLSAQSIEKDTTLARQYYELGVEYYNKQNLDSSSYYYNKAADMYKKVAEKTNDTLFFMSR